jgi:hypothetical protein
MSAFTLLQHQKYRVRSLAGSVIASPALFAGRGNPALVISKAGLPRLSASQPPKELPCNLLINKEQPQSQILAFLHGNLNFLSSDHGSVFHNSLARLRYTQRRF